MAQPRGGAHMPAACRPPGIHRLGISSAARRAAKPLNRSRPRSHSQAQRRRGQPCWAQSEGSDTRNPRAVTEGGALSGPVLRGIERQSLGVARASDSPLDGLLQRSSKSAPRASFDDQVSMVEQTSEIGGGGPLRLTAEVKEDLNSLTKSIFNYSRAYQALFGYYVVNNGIQACQYFFPGLLPLVTQPEYSWVLNSTALLNYYLCFYFLKSCGETFAEITKGDKEDSLPDVLKGIAYLTLTCTELTVVSWLFTLALVIESAMIWDGTKYFVGILILIFALVRVYGYALVNKYYGELQGFVSAVLKDSETPVKVNMSMSKIEQILLKLSLGPLAVLGLEEENEKELSGEFLDGGYVFADDDLKLFRSLSTAMFTCGVSYLVATSCTAVYYCATFAVGDDAEVVSVLYSAPEYLSQLLTGILLLETTDSFVYLVNSRPYISQYMSACKQLDNVFLGLTNVTAAMIIGNIFDLFWGDEYTVDLAVDFAAFSWIIDLIE